MPFNEDKEIMSSIWSIDGVLFGETAKHPWNGILPDKEGILNLLRILGRNTSELQSGKNYWGIADLFSVICEAMKFLPDLEIETALATPPIAGWLYHPKMSGLFHNTANRSDWFIRSVTKDSPLKVLFDDISSKFKQHIVTRAINKIPLGDAPTTYETTNHAQLEACLDIHCNPGEFGMHTDWLMSFFRYITNKDFFKKCADQIADRGWDERIAILHNPLAMEFPELVAELLPQCCALGPTFIQPWIMPKSIISLLDSGDVIGLLSNVAMSRRMEAIPEINSFLFSHLLKKGPASGTFKRMMIRAKGINHAPLSAYRTLPVFKPYIVDLYAVNHMFLPQCPTFKDWLKSNEYQALPAAVKLHQELYDIIPAGGKSHARV